MSQKNNESKVLKNQVISKIDNYFTRMSGNITKPERKCLKEVVYGILKSQRVLINQIGIQLKDKTSLKKTTERLRYHYTKVDFWLRTIRTHIMTIQPKLKNAKCMIIDLSDIQKRYAMKMEGLEYVKDGNSDKIGLGYWLMNIIGIGQCESIYPVYNKLYSFGKGTISENKEIIGGIEEIRQYISSKTIWIIDRGGDRPILIEYFLKYVLNFIIRLTKWRKLWYNDKVYYVKDLYKKMELKYELTALKTKKNKLTKAFFTGGAIQVYYEYQSKKIPMWFVCTKRQNGGYAWFLIKTDKTNEKDVVEECFRCYGYRWKIEEYHRHIKTQFNLEQIQIKKFEGLQSMLSILTITMYLIYTEISSLHDKLLLCSGIKTLPKLKIRHLRNFIYYKISTIVSCLLIDFKPYRAKIKCSVNPYIPAQLTLFDNHF